MKEEEEEEEVGDQRGSFCKSAFHLLCSKKSLFDLDLASLKKRDQKMTFSGKQINF